MSCQQQRGHRDATQSCTQVTAFSSGWYKPLGSTQRSVQSPAGSPVSERRDHGALILEQVRSDREADRSGVPRRIGDAGSEL